MTKKQLLRTVVFFIAVFMVLVVLCDLFEYQISNMSRRYEKLKDLEENTLDAVYIGTSGVDRYWIPAQAYEKYGMTVYPFSTEGEPAWLIKPMIDETLRFHDPKLFIIDVRPFLTGNYSEHIDITDVRCRRVIDMMDFFSPNRISAIKRTKDVMREIDEDFSVFDSMYYLSFVRYHNKWSDESFSFDELGVERAGYLGFYVGTKKTVKHTAIKASVYTDKTEALDSISERYLYELLDYLKEKNIEVLFVDSPTEVSEKNSAKRNTLWNILDENGFKYVTYNSPEGEALCYFDRKKGTSDFYNDSHVNYYGAVKYTDMFAEYLNENYDFEDHRNDEAVKKDWDGIYEKTVKKIKSLEEKNNK